MGGRGGAAASTFSQSHVCVSGPCFPAARLGLGPGSQLSSLAHPSPKQVRTELHSQGGELLLQTQGGCGGRDAL
jgi:hypothetical protein